MGKMCLGPAGESPNLFASKYVEEMPLGKAKVTEESWTLVRYFGTRVEVRSK